MAHPFSLINTNLGKINMIDICADCWYRAISLYYNNVTEHTGVFIANIDDVDITAADMDKATNVIEDIVKNKGLIQSNNHKISNHIVMKCSGNESWTILSETFQ